MDGAAKCPVSTKEGRWTREPWPHGSRLTRDAQEGPLAAKARGLTLGTPKLHTARKSAVDAVRAGADRYAANVLPIIREAQKVGARTLREIAEALNARGIATARGGQWYAQSVANILARA